MIKTRRAVVWLLLMSFLWTVLLSCRKEPEKDEPAATDTAAGTETEENGRVRLVDRGTAVYTLVYPDGCSSQVTDAMHRFVAAIAEATGVTLETKTDYIKRGQVYDSGTPEILFGRTDYEETAKAMKDLQDEQFVIRKVDNKIVIASPLDVNLDAAVTYFCDHLLQPNLVEETMDRKTLYLEEYTSPASDEPETLQIDGVDIGDFQIVIASTPAGLDTAAENLRQYIKDSWGVELPCAYDTVSPQTEHEILIGKTNRELSEQYYTDHSVKLMSYRFVVEDGKMLLACGGAFSAAQAVVGFQFQYKAQDNPAFAQGKYLETNLLTLDRQELTQGSNFRVMTSNILADRWVDGRPAYPAVSQRAEIYAAMLAVYQPDLIGVQESDMPWVQALPYYLNVLKEIYGLDYEWIQNKYGNLANMTSLIYNAGRLSLTESGTQEFSYVNHTNYKLRMLTWGVFADRETGKTVVLINTHWSGSGANNSTADAYQTEIREEAALLQSLTQKYENSAVFCTGDFNMHRYIEFEPFKEATGLIDSKDTAKDNGVLINELAGIPETIYVNGILVYIDHIFTNVSPESVTRYETVSINYAGNMADHMPQCGDYVI